MRHATILTVVLAASFPAAAGPLTKIYDMPALVQDAGSPGSAFILLGGQLDTSPFFEGAYGNGAIVRIDPATGKESVVWNFTGRGERRSG